MPRGRDGPRGKCDIGSAGEQDLRFVSHRKTMTMMMMISSFGRRRRGQGGEVGRRVESQCRGLVVVRAATLGHDPVVLAQTQLTAEHHFLLPFRFQTWEHMGRRAVERPSSRTRAYRSGPASVLGSEGVEFVGFGHFSMVGGSGNTTS